MAPDIVVGCSGGPNMTKVPLTSRQCHFGQWSYLAGGGFLPGTRGQDVTSTSTLPAGPPYFIHVLVYAATSRDDLPFALPHGRPQRLTDALLQSSHPAAATSLGPVRWVGQRGQLPCSLRHIPTAASPAAISFLATAPTGCITASRCTSGRRCISTALAASTTRFGSRYPLPIHER